MWMLLDLSIICTLLLFRGHDRKTVSLRSRRVNPWLKEQFVVWKTDIKFLRLNISPSIPADKSSRGFSHWVSPCVKSTLGPGLARWDGFSSWIPPVCHLNDIEGTFICVAYCLIHSSCCCCGNFPLLIHFSAVVQLKSTTTTMLIQKQIVY